MGERGNSSNRVNINSFSYIDCPLCGEKVLVRNINEPDRELDIHIDRCSSERTSRNRRMSRGTSGGISGISGRTGRRRSCLKAKDEGFYREKEVEEGEEEGEE